MELTKDQLDKIAVIVQRETAGKQRMVVSTGKFLCAMQPFLWIKFSDGAKLNMRFKSTETRDAAYTKFKEQRNDSDGQAG